MPFTIPVDDRNMGDKRSCTSGKDFEPLGAVRLKIVELLHATVHKRNNSTTKEIAKYNGF
jgi:hypothetical protein